MSTLTTASAVLEHELITEPAVTEPLVTEPAVTEPLDLAELLDLRPAAATAAVGAALAAYGFSEVRHARRERRLMLVAAVLAAVTTVVVLAAELLVR